MTINILFTDLIRDLLHERGSAATRQLSFAFMKLDLWHHKYIWTIGVYLASYWDLLRKAVCNIGLG